MVEKQNIKSIVFDAFNYILLILIFIVMVYPFLYVFNYSLSTPSQIKNPLLLIPEGINITNYKVLFSDSSIFKALLISISRSILGPALMLVVTSMGGYALSRPNLVCGRFIRLYFIATMYFSAGIIPTYLLYKTIGLTGSYWVYIIPGMVNVFNMILVKTFLESLPSSLEEAVLIDCGTEIYVIWTINHISTISAKIIRWRPIR